MRPIGGISTTGSYSYRASLALPPYLHLPISLLLQVAFENCPVNPIPELFGLVLGQDPISVWSLSVENEDDIYQSISSSLNMKFASPQSDSANAACSTSQSGISGRQLNVTKLPQVSSGTGVFIN